MDLQFSYMVGDRWRDIGAGQQAGCRTVLVDCNYAEKQAENSDIVVKSLPEAVQKILTEIKYDGNP